MTQRAWVRARSDLESVRRTWRFWVAEVVALGVAAGATAGPLVTANEGTPLVIVLTIVAAIGGPIFLLGVVTLGLLIAAPYHQRNELRSHIHALEEKRRGISFEAWFDGRFLHLQTRNRGKTLRDVALNIGVPRSCGSITRVQGGLQAPGRQQPDQEKIWWQEHHLELTGFNTTTIWDFAIGIPDGDLSVEVRLGHEDFGEWIGGSVVIPGTAPLGARQRADAEEAEEPDVREGV